jgi:quercetin dioxygenase-like cupin family protein
MSEMNRRDFAAMAPALLAMAAMLPKAEAQVKDTTPEQAKIRAAMEHDQNTHAEPFNVGSTDKSKGVSKPVVSGVYLPSTTYGTLPKRKSRRYLVGRLVTGNIQIEMHETTQEAGAMHEPVDAHYHNEIWLVREGTVELTTNGITRTMHAGDVGICVAGDLHYVRNAGDGPCTYFVVTVGPPEAVKG